MKKYQLGFMGSVFDSIAESIVILLIFIFFVGVVIGVFVSLGIPVIWDWLKPLIHGWTA